MATYVGLLRAVNLGSHNKIAMSDLREWLTGLETPFFVRTDREWHGIIADNPFPKEAKTDPRNWNTVLKLGALTEKS